MSRITLPAGQSVREVAQRLGVPVEKLQKHARVSDVEAPLGADQLVEVPDGFLRARPEQEKRMRDAIPTETGKAGGMNYWLAMDIEHKRSRAAGEKARDVADYELEGLAEARRAYERFEADSNELAIRLFDQLTVTHAIDVRAQAFAGQGLAYAQRYHLFGEPAGRAKAQSLSSAKGALLADPKLADAHLAMAMALRIEPAGDDVADAVAELERGMELAPEEPGCASELAALRLQIDDSEGASEMVDKALAIDERCVLALKVGAEIAQNDGNLARSRELLERAVEETPTFTWASEQLERVVGRLNSHSTFEAQRASGV